MIKHIVLFRLKDEAEGNSKSQNAIIVKDMLDKLPHIIDEIEEYEVGINIFESEKSWDLSLISTFSCSENLEKYRKHPEHQLVVDFIKEVADTTAVVDYEI